MNETFVMMWILNENYENKIVLIWFDDAHTTFWAQLKTTDDLFMFENWKTFGRKSAKITSKTGIPCSKI